MQLAGSNPCTGLTSIPVVTCLPSQSHVPAGTLILPRGQSLTMQTVPPEHRCHLTTQSVGSVQLLSAQQKTSDQKCDEMSAANPRIASEGYSFPQNNALGAGPEGHGNTIEALDDNAGSFPKSVKHDGYYHNQHSAETVLTETIHEAALKEEDQHFVVQIENCELFARSKDQNMINTDNSSTQGGEENSQQVTLEAANSPDISALSEKENLISAGECEQIMNKTQWSRITVQCFCTITRILKLRNTFLGFLAFQLVQGGQTGSSTAKLQEIPVENRQEFSAPIVALELDDEPTKAATIDGICEYINYQCFLCSI